MLRLPADHVAKFRDRYTDRCVLVTGGAGFIGGHLVDALVSLGARVRVIDDLSASNADHLSELIDLEPDRVRFMQASILDSDALAEASSACDVVFHLAAVGSVPRSIESPQRSWDVNATGTVRVLEAARAAGAKRVVLAASSSAYGDTEQLPKIETMLAKPRSPYAASKLAAEHAAHAWAASYGLDTACLRYFNVFGPRQPAGSAYAAVIPAFTAKLLKGEPPIIFGDGQQSRDFTFVANVVLATLLAGSAAEPLGGAAINIGGGERTTLIELAVAIASLTCQQAVAPEHLPERSGDVKHSIASLERAALLIGYRPFVDVEEGLKITVEAMRSVTAGTPARSD